jgi:hypothetical protein
MLSKKKMFKTTRKIINTPKTYKRKLGKVSIIPNFIPITSIMFFKQEKSLPT